MDDQAPEEATEISAHDLELKSFLLGNNEEPKNRVLRRDVPNRRTQFRAPLLWKRYFTQTRFIRQAEKAFNYGDLVLKPDSKQIRLLRLHPQRAENFDKRVVCDLYIVDLAKAKNKFEALSYCWGDGQPDQMVSIQNAQVDTAGKLNCGRSQDFPVRSNLNRALKHLRHTTRFVSLWVDAICINQRDYPGATAEKNRQLSMMSEIYNSAKNVCIWLGDSDEQSTKALDFVHKVNDFSQLEACLSVADDMTTGHWRNFIETLKTTQWFSRRWIIQEVASARSASVHCGHGVVHWDDFAVAISILEENQVMMEHTFSPKPLFAQISTLSATQLVKSLTHVYRKSATGEMTERLLDLETLVCTFQQFQARFPEDVIRSVQALASDPPGSNESDLSMNGKKSTPDLFIAFVHRCIERSGSRDIICRHWALPVTDKSGNRVSLPSWISDLTNAPFGLPGTSHERQNGENFVAVSPHRRWKQYHASGNWKPDQDEQFRQKDPQTRASAAHFQWLTDSVPMPTSSLEPICVDIREDNDSMSFPTTAGIRNRPIISRLDETSLRNAIQEPRPKSAGSLNHPLTEEDTTSGAMPSPKGRKRSMTVSSQEQSKPSGFNSVLSALSSPNGLATIRELVGGESSPNKRTSGPLQGTFVQEGKSQLHRVEHVGYLNVPGFVLGIVNERSDTMREGVISCDWIEKLRQGGDQTNAVPDQLWRTLVADRTENGNSLPEWYKRACLHCLEDSRFVNSQGDLNTNRSLSDTPLDTMTSEYLERAKSVVWRRRFMQLKLGTAFKSELVCGLGPEKCERGDIVCIIGSCTVPVVLRRVEDVNRRAPAGSAGLFTLIGEAYVHGKMNGEAVQDLERVKELQGTFVLV